MLEENLRPALLLSRGDMMVFMTRPISGVCMVIAFIMIDRPYFFTHASTPSFPSNHTTIIWSIAAVLLANNWRSPSGWLVFIMGAAMAWARIFLGVHFPLDMLGSLVVATVVAFFIRISTKRLIAYFPLK